MTCISYSSKKCKLDILYIISICLSKKYITIIANILCEKLLCLSHGNEANIKKKITKYILTFIKNKHRDKSIRVKIKVFF